MRRFLIAAALLIFLQSMVFIAVGGADTKRKVNRTPTILTPPTKEPTGKNAAIYKELARQFEQERAAESKNMPKTN